MLWACGAGEVPEEPLQIPEVDGEAWDAHIELGRPGHRIEIRAAYLREFSKSEQVVATGGVAVTFRGDEAVSTLRAERLVLEHKRDRFGLAGGVVLRAGDSLEVQADTLLWENAHEQLRIPGALRVEVGEGREWGRNLTSNFAVDAWTLEAVEGLWRGRDGAVVEVRARREESRRVEGVQEITYDSVEVRYDGVQLTGPRATFLPQARRFDLSGGVEGADSLAQFAADEVAVDAEKQRLVAQGAVRYREEDAELRADEVEEGPQRRAVAGSRGASDLCAGRATNRGTRVGVCTSRARADGARWGGLARWGTRANGPNPPLSARRPSSCRGRDSPNGTRVGWLARR